jgi:hypothetical protein
MQWSPLSIGKERPIGNKLDPGVDFLCSRFRFFKQSSATGYSAP